MAARLGAPGRLQARRYGGRPLRVCDVALLPAPRAAGISAYLEAKLAEAPHEVDEFLVLPGRRVQTVPAGRVAAASCPTQALSPAGALRRPPGHSRLERTVAVAGPDVVLLHDPIWIAPRTIAALRRSGATVVAVLHGGIDALDGLGPEGALRRARLRRACRAADLVAGPPGAVGPGGRSVELPFEAGIDEAFGPGAAAGVGCGDRVLHVCPPGGGGPGTVAVLEAAARAREPWPLTIVGAGGAEGRLRARAARYGIAQRVAFVPAAEGARARARAFADARCVVAPESRSTRTAVEAAACGAAVVVPAASPAARACGELAHRFAPGDLHGLAEAVADARAAPSDPATAAALAWRLHWPTVLAAERRTLAAL